MGDEQMSYYLHMAIIVVSHDTDEIRQLHTVATELLGRLVTPIIETGLNNVSSFAVLPDGSKEGWPDSDLFDSRRALLITQLEQSATEWTEVAFSHDQDDL